MASSAASTYCSGCCRSWTSIRYRTCDKCRQRQSYLRRSRLRRSRPDLPSIASSDSISSIEPTPMESMSTPICSGCGRDWIPDLYQTCDKCRDRLSKRRRKGLRARALNDTDFAARLIEFLESVIVNAVEKALVEDDSSLPRRSSSLTTVATTAQKTTNPSLPVPARHNVTGWTL